MAGRLLNDELKTVWDEVVVNHVEKKVTVATIVGNSKQAVPDISVELPQHHPFLPQTPVHYSPCMYYTGSLF
jgi:hypothetical protein